MSSLATRWLNLAAVWVCGCGAALAQRPIVELRVAGNDRIKAGAVIAASGLHLKQVVARKDLDAAGQQLFNTGYFSMVNYRYDPKQAGGESGFSVTLEVTEEKASTPVVLDIPGIEESQLWAELLAGDGLAGKYIPDNDRATAYFTHAIEAVLRKANRQDEIVMKNEGDLHSNQRLAVFHPARLPKVAALQFEGNAAISTEALQAAMSKAAIWQDYTERDFRKKLELNLRPLYEEKGYLTVGFPRVKMAASGADAEVTTEVNEGPVWKLGKVDLRGEGIAAPQLLAAGGFAMGDTANWKEFLSAVGRMERELKHDGYIAVASKPARAFRDEGRTVDVTIDVQKGKQFYFGELRVKGLDEAAEKQVMGLWTLPSGAPMNQPYIGEYVRAAALALRGKIKSASSTLNVRPETSVADVEVTFH
jgi:outer membrane protein assembly factor BamA